MTMNGFPWKYRTKEMYKLLVILFVHSQKKRYSLEARAVYYGFLLFMEINLKFIWRPAGGAWCKVKWLNRQEIFSLAMIWMTCL